MESRSSESTSSSSTTNESDDELRSLDALLNEGEIGLRTYLMVKKANRRDWEITNENGYFYITMRNDESVKKVKVVTSKITDFRSEKLLFAGVADKQEFIEFDPNSEVIKKLYANLKRQLNGVTDWRRKVEITSEFIRQVLGTNRAKGDGLEKKVEAFCSNPSHPNYYGRKYITMDGCVNSRVGVCRHHSLLMAHFIDRLRFEGELPEGVVHIVREKLKQDKSSAHVWVIYQTKETNDIYLIDSLWDNFRLITDQALVPFYTAAALHRCVKRLNHSDDQYNCRSESNSSDSNAVSSSGSGSSSSSSSSDSAPRSKFVPALAGTNLPRVTSSSDLPRATRFQFSTGSVLINEAATISEAWGKLDREKLASYKDVVTELAQFQRDLLNNSTTISLKIYYKIFNSNLKNIEADSKLDPACKHLLRGGLRLILKLIQKTDPTVALQPATLARRSIFAAPGKKGSNSGEGPPRQSAKQ